MLIPLAIAVSTSTVGQSLKTKHLFSAYQHV